MTERLSWEAAVTWLRQQPDRQDLVRASYYDDPLLDAATRFADSEEWAAVRTLLPHHPGRALDLGAGRGIGSFALARDGWSVAALEPDSSALVGAGAIRQLAQESGLPICVVEEYAETLPFDEATFDLVYGRQVLHHARDLRLLCLQVARVLKPGGRFIATREHVISRRQDLDRFLQNHPLHKFYGGENAYLLKEYTTALNASGLHLRNVLGKYDSVINYFPMTDSEWQLMCIQPLTRIVGYRVAYVLTSRRHLVGRCLLDWLAHRLSNLSDLPGRLYSFVADKPLI